MKKKLQRLLRPVNQTLFRGLFGWRISTEIGDLTGGEKDWTQIQRKVEEGIYSRGAEREVSR